MKRVKNLRGKYKVVINKKEVLGFVDQDFFFYFFNLIFWRFLQSHLQFSVLQSNRNSILFHNGFYRYSSFISYVSKSSILTIDIVQIRNLNHSKRIHIGCSPSLLDFRTRDLHADILCHQSNNRRSIVL